MPLDKLQSIPPSAVSISDYEALARERLTDAAWGYLGGAGDEITMRENAEAFARLSLNTRVLRDLQGGNTRLELLGRTFASPMLLAPVAYHKIFHPDAEIASVAAASAMRTGMIVSTQASVSLEDVAAAAKEPLWFQLYIQHDRAFTAELVKRAEAAGYAAIVLTVDAPVSGLRDGERRLGFTLPAGVEAANLRGRKPNPADEGGRAEMLLGGPLLDTAPTWKDVAWLRSLTKLPLVLKGAMTADDAKRAMGEGADAIVVSNHGGRMLDTQPAAISVLPEIADALVGRLPLLMDGGIRRGGDVLKALALGAKAVLIGRPYIYGLAAAGAPGVAHVLRILRAEFEVAMALTGCRDLAAIDGSLIRR